MAARDSDSARRTAILVWALLIGGFLALPVGFYLAVERGLPFWTSVLVAALLISTLIYLGTATVVGVGAAPVRLLYPKGDGVAGAPRYLSRAQALVARGRPAEAREVFEEALRSDPNDHLALLALADLFSGPLGDAEAGRGFVRRALSTNRLEPPIHALQMRRIAESLLEGPSPLRAAPDLARLAERFPDSAHGIWARARLRELKREIE